MNRLYRFFVISAFIFFSEGVYGQPIGRIAFYSDGDIYAINTDGTNRQNLTHFPSDFSSFDISQNGKRIIFDSTRNGTTDIFVMDDDGSNLHNITQDLLHRHNLRPVWLSNSIEVIYEKIGAEEGDILPCSICQYSFDSNREQDINDIGILYPDPNRSYGVTWSPDGQSIAYSNLSSGNLHIVNTDGSSDMSIALGEYPSWSPDSKKIVFNSPDNFADLFIINRDGSNLIQLTNRVVSTLKCTFSHHGLSG